MKTHFLQALPPSEKYIFTNSNEEKTCLLLCLLFIFKCQTLRACLHGVGDPGLVGLVSFVSRSGGHKTKETYPTRPGSPTPCKQGLIYLQEFVNILLHVEAKPV